FRVKNLFFRFTVTADTSHKSRVEWHCVQCREILQEICIGVASAAAVSRQQVNATGLAYSLVPQIVIISKSRFTISGFNKVLPMVKSVGVLKCQQCKKCDSE